MIPMGGFCMRDDRAKWLAPALFTPSGVERRLVAGGLALRRIVADRQILASGPQTAALRLCGFEAAIGWPDIAQNQSFAVSLRRDRLLALNTRALPTGWLADDALAVSDVTDGFDIIEIRGSGALDFLRTGTEVSLGESSGSAQRLWHGFDVILYRHGDPMTFRLHVAAGQAEGLWALLAAQMAVLAR